MKGFCYYPLHRALCAPPTPTVLSLSLSRCLCRPACPNICAAYILHPELARVREPPAQITARHRPNTPTSSSERRKLLRAHGQREQPASGLHRWVPSVFEGWRAFQWANLTCRASPWPWRFHQRLGPGEDLQGSPLLRFSARISLLPTFVSCRASAMYSAGSHSALIRDSECIYLDLLLANTGRSSYLL